jgi:hypothetical protein
MKRFSLTVGSVGAVSVGLLVAWLAQSGGVYPAAGQCVDCEVMLVDADDAGEVHAKHIAYRICGPSPDASADSLVTALCKKAARKICADDPDDPGNDDKDCEKAAKKECLAEAPFTARIIQCSPPADDPDPTNDAGKGPITRIPKAESALGCACSGTHDAGRCKWWTPGADAAVEAPYQTTLPAGSWSGKGCVLKLCTETTEVMLEQGPGYSMPPECFEP